MSWTAPEHDGGLPVTRYSIQWDTADTFAASVQTVSLTDRTGPGPFSYTIASSVTSGTAYFVRILASNEVGFGPPAVADVPAAAREEIQTVTLTSSSAGETAGQWRFVYNNQHTAAIPCTVRSRLPT